MNFEIKENELGYFGIKDKETGEMIIPCLFNSDDELKTIEKIEKDNGNYILYAKESKINGFYDIQNSMIVLPNNKSIKYYNIKKLKENIVKNIKICDDLSVKIVGKHCTQINYKNYIYKVKKSDIKEVDDYKLIKDKVLALKCNGKIVSVFDLEEKELLPIDLVVSDDIVITYKEIYHSKTNGGGQLSIVDLNNEKFLKNIFNKEYHYIGIIDEYEEIYGTEISHKYTLSAHKEKIDDYNINIKENTIEFVNGYNSKNNGIIYDIKHGVLVKDIKTSLKNKNSSLYVTSIKDNELKAYDANIGKTVTLSPIKVEYSSVRRNNNIGMFKSNSIIYHEEFEKTIFKSIETGKYYELSKGKPKRVENEIPKKPYNSFDSDEEYYYYKYIYNYDPAKAIKELKVESKEIYDIVKLSDDKYVYISKFGGVLKVSDSKNTSVSLLSDEKISKVNNKIDKALNKPEVYEYLSNPKIEEEITSYISRYNNYPNIMPSLLGNINYKSNSIKKIIKKIEKILKDETLKESSVDLSSLKTYISSILDQKIIGKNNKIEKIKNVYVMDDELIIELPDNLLKIDINDGFIVNLMNRKFKSNIENKKKKFKVIEKNGCYGLIDKQNSTVIPCILPVKYYSQEEVINIKEVKKIMETFYLIISENDYLGLTNKEKKLVSAVYENCEFEGTNLVFKNNDLKTKINISINSGSFLNYYLNMLKNEKLNSYNLIEKLKNVIPSNIHLSFTDDKYDIINENVLIFKFGNKKIICDLNNLNHLTQIYNYNTDYKIINNQVLLFDDFGDSHIYDMKHHKYLKLNGKITEDGVFLTGKDIFYDMRNGFLLAKSYSDEAYRYNSNAHFITINNKLYYARNKDKKKITGIYDLNEAENREEEKFTELKELNVIYDDTFILESKDGKKVFDKHVESIVEIDKDLAKQLNIDISFIDDTKELFSDVLYLINNQLYCVYKIKKGEIFLGQIPMYYENDNVESGKTLTLNKRKKL